VISNYGSGYQLTPRSIRVERRANQSNIFTAYYPATAVDSFDPVIVAASVALFYAAKPFAVPSAPLFDAALSVAVTFVAAFVVVAAAYVAVLRNRCRIARPQLPNMPMLLIRRLLQRSASLIVFP
jgi:hypothetical protein